MRPVLIILALVASVIAVPTGQRTTCVSQCQESTTNFAYETGKRYVYQYEAATSTALLVTLNDHADVHITATAHVDVTSPCDYTLTLTDVVLDGSSHTEEFAAAVTKSPLRFSFQDGHVEAVCSEGSEPAWVLNFKRGVLSTFQSTMRHPTSEILPETDVSGTCLTHYRSRVEGSVKIIDKVKDLSSCTHRPDLAAYIASTPYMTDSPMQSLPIFNSTNSCHQTIEAGILKTAECHETHKFQPFSSEEGGAVTTVKTTFTLVSQDQPALPIPYSQFLIKSMVYEQTTSGSSQTAVEVINQLLADLDQASHGEVRPEVPALFSNLVASLKPLDYPTLSTLYFTDKESHSHKFLVDAMPLVGTAAAVEVMKDIIINGDISQSEADAWFTSLAFQKNPTTDMFNAIAPLLETPSQQAVLGASALVNTYCKLHSNCEADAGVQLVLRAIETQLGSSCGTINQQDKMKVLVALKGLGNAGHWVNANQVLQSCYIEHNDMEVRVAAIEAWRHTPCTYDRSHLLAAFQDETQDSEVRIAAYLAVMTCPTETVVNIVKDRLTSEAVNQVGSFIWTHLTNLQESAAPGKQWVREMIGEELLQNKFNTEALKFSRNYESSFFTNELNVGATVESNVIFSSASHLPRSSMLNLTLDLFGESINLFEVGGRIQGIESFLERFFGPTGYFPQEMVEGILKNMRQNKPDAEETTLEQFLDTVTDDIEGSYYLRVFGKELHYNHFHGLDGLLPTSNPIEVLMELARQGNIDYTKSYQLINSDYSIPTVSGLPVTLSAKGMATIALRMNGNFNANSLTNFNIEGHFHPSVAVQMDGVMMVDAHVARKGLQISSTLHTSTFVDGKVHINGGKLVDLVINTPKDKVEVINVNTKFFIVEDDVLVEKDVEAKVHYEGCTPNILGGHLCGELTYTPMTTYSPFFPLSGPFSAQLYLEKTDTQTGYVFHYAYNPQEISVQFDTPGSQVAHKAALTFNRPDTTVIVDINNQFLSVHGTGQFTLATSSKQLTLEFVLDNSEKYSLEAAVEVANEGTTIQPRLVITAPNGPILNIHSSFGGQLGDQSNLVSRVDVEYLLIDGMAHNIHHTAFIKKEVIPDLTTYSSAFELTSTQYPILSLSLVHNTKVSPGHVETHGRLARETVAWDLDHSFTYINENDQKSITLDGSIKCPAWNIEYTSSHKIEVVTNMINMKSHVHLSPIMNYGIDVALNKVENQQFKAHIVATVEDHKWEFNGELKNESVPGNIRGTLECSLVTPSQNFALKGDIHGDSQSVGTALMLSLNGQVYTITIEGSTTSIMADINIIKHIVLSAYVSDSGEVKKLHVSAEWDKDVNPTMVLLIDGTLSHEELAATLKVLDHEMSASGKVVANGLELVGQWAGDQSVVAKIHYSLEDTKSLSVVIETPFPGWQKQDITVAVSINQNEFNARAVANWKNSEQVALTVSGNLQPGLTNNALNTNILFSSTFNNFELLTFTFDHKMASFNIDTIMEAAWNDIKINGAIRIAPTETGLDGSATLTSPFTQEAVVTLHHELVNTQLSTSLEAKYGTHVSTFNLNGHMNFDQVHDVALTLKVHTPLQFVPEIEFNVVYSFTESSLNLMVDGKIVDQKMMLNVNGEKTVTDTSTTVTGGIRFITPFTLPLTINLNHNHNGQQFTSQLEASGGLKIHADGHFISKNDVAFNVYFSNPISTSSIIFSHKIEGDKMTSIVEVSVDGQRIGASVNGVLNIAESVANIEVDIISTLRGLDDIKINLNTKKQDNTWVSKVIIGNGSISATVNHTFTFIDYFNWENIFLINDIFQMSSKMTHTGSASTLDFESKYGDMFVKLATTFDLQISQELAQIDAGATLTSTWTDPIKVGLHVQEDGTEFKQNITVEYVPGQVIEVTNMMRIQSSSIHAECSIITPFWQPLGCKLNIGWDTAKTASLELTRGSNKTVITINGNWESFLKMDTRLDVTSTYLPIPLTIEGSYDISSAEKTVSLTVTKDHTYSITAAISGELKNAHWRIITVLPIPSAHDVLIQGEYNISAMPLTAKAEVDINTKKYVADIVLNPHDIQINMDVEGRQGLLTTNWDFHGTNANMDITFQSPVDIIGDMKIHAMYDIGEEIKMNINVNDGAAEITVLGKLGDILVPEVMLTITTPFDQVKSLQAGAKLNIWDPAKTAHINFHLNDNHYTLDLEIYADGLLKGHVASKITTTIPGWTTFNLMADTDFTTMPIKGQFIYEREEVAHKVEGHLSFSLTSFTGEATTTVPGWEQLAFKGEYMYQDHHILGNMEINTPSDSYYIRSEVQVALLPKVKLTMHTPFEYVKNVEFNFEMMTTDTNSIIRVSFQRVDAIYSAELTLQHTYKVGLTKLVLHSPIPGYTTIDIQATYDFTGDVKKADVVLNIEGNNIPLSVAAQVNDNNVHLDIITPFEGYETIKIMGDYTVSNGQHTLMATLDTTAHKYDFHFDISTVTKELSFTLTTPIAALQIVKVYGKADILNHGLESVVQIQSYDNALLFKVHGDLVSEVKSAGITFRQNDYEKLLNIEAKFTLESGYVKLQTPVEGFEVLSAEYTATIDTTNHNMEIRMKFTQAAHEWVFITQGNYTPNSVYLGLTTPFDFIPFVSLSFEYNLEVNKIHTALQLTYSQHHIVLTTTLNISPVMSEFTFHASTPILNYENVSFMAKYDINNRDNLATIDLTVGPYIYNFLMAGYIEDTMVYFKSDLTTPFPGWTGIKFEAKIDLTSDEKILDISLTRDENVKIIGIHGKLIGTIIDFNWETPLSFLPNVVFSGVLDQAEKSLTINLISDVAEVSIVANLVHVKINIKTPFEVAQTIIVEIGKVSDGVYKAEWRRNDHYAVIAVERHDRINSINLKIHSEIPGLEMVSLVGSLNEETMEALISGSINEEKVEITSSATFDIVGKMNIHIETPFEQIRTVDISFDYDMQEKLVKVEASSSPSSFHSLLKVSPSEGLEFHLLVPNSEKNTEIIINMGLYSGKVAITSRFDIITSFLYQYDIHVASPTTVTAIVQLNNVELVNLSAMVNTAEHTVQFTMKILNVEIHYQHQAFTSLTFDFKYLGETEKHFRIDVTGTGSLPTQGALNVVITNSFLQIPHTFTGYAEFDVASEQKHVVLEFTPNPDQLYKLDLVFSFAYATGNIELGITTPERMPLPWKHIAAKFNVQNLDQVQFEVTYGQETYTLQGKLGFFESNLVMSTGSEQENIILQWNIILSDNDYFIKVGRESRYIMLKLKLTFQDIGHVDMEGGFKFGGLMQEELIFTNKFILGNDGVFTKEGTMTYGEYHAESHLKMTLDINTYLATFSWTATTNIPGMNVIDVILNLNFDHKFVINGLIKMEEEEAKIDIIFDNFHLDHSHNTMDLLLPFLPSTYKNINLIVSHDFREPTTKSVSVVLNMGGVEHSAISHLSYSDHFDMLSLNTEIKSVYIGDLHLIAKYNINTINDVTVELEYARNTPSQETKHINLKMSWKLAESHYEIEVLVNTTFFFIPKARIFTIADFTNGIHLSSELEIFDMKGTIGLDINEGLILIQVTTPFTYFESIAVKVNYNLSGNNKKVALIYERGTNKIELNGSLNIQSLMKGKVYLTLTTPYDIIQVLHLEVSWKNNIVHTSFKVNDTEYTMNVKMDLDIENSSFEVTINIPGWQVIRFATTFDVHDFLVGSLSDIHKLAETEIEIEGQAIIFSIMGIRNGQKILLDFGTRTTFEDVADLHIRLNGEINDDSLTGTFEVLLGEFVFKVTNLYEKRGEDGYYVKSMIQTTLTPLPALILGFGCNGAEHTLTIGYGADKEITFSIQGKDYYMSGFSGNVDIPNFGYEGVTYDVSYGFQEDKFLMSANIELGPNGQKIEVEFLYGSDGVVFRMTSPLTGERSLRFRRSVSTDNFSAEAALNQYSIQLRGGFKDGDLKKGALLEVDIMDYKFLFDFLLQSEGLQYSEGKLIIMTPFPHLKNMGGLFTLSTQDKVISGQAEVILPFFNTPQIKMEINLDLNQKVEGNLTFDIAGEKFIFKSNLAGESLAQGFAGAVELHTPLNIIHDIILNTNIKIVQWSSVEISMGINDKTVAVGFTVDESTFKTLIDTQFGDVHNKLTFDISLPSGSYEHIIFDASLTSSESHSLHLEVNMAAGVMATVSVDTPLAPKLSVSLNLQPNRAELVLETPSGQHKVTLHGRMTYRMPADYIVMMDVASPLLSHTYSVAILLNGDVNNMVAKAELQVDDIKHTLEGKTIISDQAGEVSITLETPFRNINKLSLAVSLNLVEQAEMLITASTVDKVSTVHMTFDQVNRKFMILATSPFIPEGEASLEAILMGDMNPNMKLKIAIKYGATTLSGILNLKLASSDNMMVNLKLTTPFRGYKKMNFLVRYKKTDGNIITITIDKPIALNLELHLASILDKIMAEMKLETSIMGFELLDVKMGTPLNVFAPNMSVDLKLAENHYDAHLGVRAAAPYELGLGYRKNLVSHGLHLRTDSSFFPIHF